MGCRYISIAPVHAYDDHWSLVWGFVLHIIVHIVFRAFIHSLTRCFLL
jgi:hypothetical protein